MKIKRKTRVSFLSDSNLRRPAVTPTVFFSMYSGALRTQRSTVLLHWVLGLVLVNCSSFRSFSGRGDFGTVGHCDQRWTVGGGGICVSSDIIWRFNDWLVCRRYANGPENNTFQMPVSSTLIKHFVVVGQVSVTLPQALSDCFLKPALVTSNWNWKNLSDSLSWLTDCSTPDYLMFKLVRNILLSPDQFNTVTSLNICII